MQYKVEVMIDLPRKKMMENFKTFAETGETANV